MHPSPCDEWDPSSIEWLQNYTHLFTPIKKNIIKKNITEFKQFVKMNKNNLGWHNTQNSFLDSKIALYTN